MPKVETKVCTKCDEAKPFESFEKLRRGGQVYLRGVCYRCRLGKPAIQKPTPKFKRPLSGKRYLITSAQNVTPVHAEFFKALQGAAKHLDAELVVIPLRYRNPTSPGESHARESDARWAPEVQPYLFNDRKKLGPSLMLVGDVKTQPTAGQPLSGFESLTGSESCIIGHPKMALRSVAVPTERFPKLLSTTGSCTRSNNYSDTKAGKVGAFHHFLGAVFVELKGSKFWLWQINADRKDGSFIHRDELFAADGVQKATAPLGFVFGDIHARYIDPKVDRATFGPDGLVSTLDPEGKSTLVFHDVVDGDSVNPHHVGDPFLSAAKSRAGLSSVEDEVAHVIDFVNSRAQGRAAAIVESNHHAFLARWVLRHDWKQDPKNARFYLETALAMLASATVGPGGATYRDPFEYWVRKMGIATTVKMLGPDESFKLGTVECGMHGHRGPNGARGSLKNLSRLGARVITGHSHTPGIEEGHYQVGTSTPLRLEYTHGPSSWLNCHCIVYANGKRSLVFINEGEWRA